MSSIEIRNVVGGIAGLSFTAVLLLGQEASQDFNPADYRQEQVETCAPHMPTRAVTGAREFPSDCVTFKTDMTAGPGGIAETFDLPARVDFVEDFSPGEYYNLETFGRFALRATIYGALGGLVAGVATGAVQTGFKNRREKRQTHTEIMKV